MRGRLIRNRRLTRKQRNALLLLCGALCCGVLLFCLGSLARYASDARRTASEEEQFRQLYYASEPPGQSAAAVTPAPAVREFTVALEPTPTPVPAGNPGPTAAPWPDNPEMAVSPAFNRLRKANKDIIGWLAIPGMLEQPVVQRDNEYYLGRDAMKLHNANGALFLEEHISLSARPDTYIIFGHNMKSGEMFGSLRLYEDAAYYRQNALVDFNVLYEDGKYAVFSVADVDILNGLGRYVPFMQLGTMTPEERSACIRQLQEMSMIRSPLQVDAEDQLLLLVTCEGSEHSRRVVAARRLRAGETAETLKTTLKHAGRRQ